MSAVESRFFVGNYVLVTTIDKLGTVNYIRRKLNGDYMYGIILDNGELIEAVEYELE